MSEVVQPTPTIDVLIVTVTARLVLSCLEHLAAQTVPHQVRVAINGGDHDGAATTIGERFPAVEVVVNADNLGFGRAVNALAQRGSGEAIVLLNDDVDVEPRFLEALTAPLTDPTVGMVAGLMLAPGAGPEVVDGFGIEVDPTLLPYNRLRHRSPADRPGVLLGPSGGAAAYRRTAWERAGGLDRHFFMYSEDLDLALRLRLAGWSAAGAAEARGVHLGGASATADSPLQRRHAGFGRAFVLRRYGVLRSRQGPRALLVELLVVLNGLVTARTSVPLRARVAGWRAAGQVQRLSIPDRGVDSGITLRQALHRLRHAR